MSAAEPGDPRQFLIFLDQGIGFAVHFFDRNFNLDLPPGAAAGLSGAHIYLSNFDPSERPLLERDDRLSGIGCLPECKDLSRAASNSGVRR